MPIYDLTLRRPPERPYLRRSEQLIVPTTTVGDAMVVHVERLRLSM